MTYKVRWHEKTTDDLLALDRDKREKIIKRVKEHLAEDPIKLGKPLKGIFKGLYRYRYGDYRIIFALDRQEMNILVMRIGGRKDIYDQEP